MKAKDYLRILLMAFLTVTGLTACIDDEPKDSVKEIKMQVSSETGIMYAWPDDRMEHPIECMLVESEDFPDKTLKLAFNEIEGFTYERGHEYNLSVKRTILANPPADASDRTYSLIKILADRLVADPELPVDKEIKSEEDIEYHDLCPLEKYAICKEFIVDKDGNISYGDGSSLPSFDHARIWLENILDSEDPNWVKIQTVSYQATYSYVFSPFTDKIRLVRNESSGPMFKNVVPEEEFTRIQAMNSGDEVSYALILANVHKKGLQRVEFTIKKH